SDHSSQVASSSTARPRPPRTYPSHAARAARAASASREKSSVSRASTAKRYRTSIVLSLLRAWGAQAVEFDRVSDVGETVLGGDLVGPALDGGPGDLDVRAAVAA